MVKLQGGNFITSKTVKTGDIVTIKDEGQWEPSRYLNDDGTPQQQFNITIDYKGEEKKVKFTKASRESFSKKYTSPGQIPETKDWVGKQGQITIIPTASGPSIWIQPLELI